MLYNGVELPCVEDIWTNTSIFGGKKVYPYALIIKGTTSTRLWFSKGYPYISGSDITLPDGHARFDLTNGEWIKNREGNTISLGQGTIYLLWTSHDILNSDGSVFLAATDPVDPNLFTGTMTYYTGHFGSDFSNTTYHVDGLADSDTYFIRGYCYQDSSLVVTVDSPAWTGPGTYCTVEFSGLSPSTTYDFEFVLYVNDEETSVTDTKSVTTLAASSEGGDSEGGDGSGDGGGTSGGCTECPSILSAILSAITNQSTFFADWKQDWLSRMDSLEEAIVTAVAALTPVPDPTETALKEAAKETTQAVTDSLYADDAPTKVTASDVKDVAEIGFAASSMFDSGVSIGAFFDALNNVSFLSVFTQEMVNSMNTVNAVSAISEDGFDSTEYYHKNLEEIRDFVNGG